MRDLAEEVHAFIRLRTARVIWLFAWALVPVALYIAARVVLEGTGAAGVSVVLGLYAATLAVLAFARRNPTRSRVVPVLVLLAAVPAASLVVLGPGPGGIVGLVTVGMLASVFLGLRGGLVWWLGTALVYGAIIVVYVRGDQVGLAGLWTAPRWLAINDAIVWLAWMAMAIAAVSGVMNGLARAISEHRDAVERERAERESRLRALGASARLDAIGRLAGGVVHDTRNALTVLHSGLEELERQPLEESGRELLRDMRSALEASQETMRQLLTLGAGPAETAADVELAERVDRFARAVARLMPSNITLRVEPRAPGRARVSPALLDQALLNLALNARDAMPEGGVLRLGVDRDSDDGHPVLCVEVEDGGVGIPPELMSRLFEPFASTKGDGRGTGLGLSMVQRFAEDAGGRVEVESRPGRGTRFRMLLPESNSSHAAGAAGALGSQ